MSAKSPAGFFGNLATSFRVIFVAAFSLVFFAVSTAQTADEAAKNNAALNNAFALTAERLHRAPGKAN